MAHGDAREGKWRGKMRMEWVASSLALYVGTRSIQSLSADPHSSTASSRLNWHPSRFKWTRPFRWKTKSGFCACAITFRTCYTTEQGSEWAPHLQSREQPLVTYKDSTTTTWSNKMRKLQSDKLDMRCVNRSCAASVSQSCVMQCYVIRTVKISEYYTRQLLSILWKP